MTKYTQKSWTHTVSSGALSPEELAARWEKVFGKKDRPKRPGASRAGLKGAKKKPA